LSRTDDAHGRDWDEKDSTSSETDDQNSKRPARACGISWTCMRHPLPSHRENRKRLHRKINTWNFNRILPPGPQGRNGKGHKVACRPFERTTMKYSCIIDRHPLNILRETGYDISCAFGRDGEVSSARRTETGQVFIRANVSPHLPPLRSTPAAGERKHSQRPARWRYEQRLANRTDR
jgi:hypothetical protein